MIRPIFCKKKNNKQDKDRKPNVIINWISNRTTYMKLVYQPPFTMNFDCAHILLLKTIKLTLVIHLLINLCIEIFIRYGKNEFCLLTKYPLVYDFSILGDARPAQLHCPIFFCMDLFIIYLIFFFQQFTSTVKKDN